MKKTRLSALALILALSMIVPTLASCKGNEQTDTTQETTQSTTTEAVTDETESNTDTSSDSNDPEEDTSGNDGNDNNWTGVDSIPLVGPYASTVELSNKLANGVTVFYPSGKRDHIIIENSSMSLDYSTSAVDDKYVSSIRSASGKAYVENTMDVFVKMKNSERVFYASKSSSHALMNTYRYGYYYYQVLLDGQDFTDTINVEKELPLGLGAHDSAHDLAAQTPTSSNAVSYKVTSTYDPRLIYTKSLTPFACADYNYLSITMKIDSKDACEISSTTVWLIAGEKTSFGSQSVGFKPVADGEFHTYYVKLDGVADYTGNVTGIRFDLDGCEGDVFEIKDVKAVKANTDSAPLLGLNRIFNTYSDKLIQTLQVTAKDNTSGIEEIGMITHVSASTVDKLIVKDSNGTHSSLDGVDWSSAEYVAFDIKNVGIFGYILLPDDTSGKLSVSLEGDKYVITQSRAPEGNTLLKPTDTTLNTGDFYMGQRIYTDESHDFTAFLHEAYCERNPLPAQNITIDHENSTKGAYVGYNALRGSYEFSVQSSGFGTAYYYEQNKHYGVKFTVKGDGYDRTLYIQSSLDAGQLECSAVLDANDLMLPIPVEVCKNFSDGDRTIHWIQDTTYSETYFPVSLSGNDEQTYNLLHLYQNWGRFPLKQISSIQFHCPYYHLSTGVTETNCIVNWYTTKSSRSIYSVLPDHRPMSAPLWAREPQHTSGGSHGFLEYTDADGNYSATENTRTFITSYGPTYAEIVMDYISDDGKIKVSYTHMEMPQTDENRTYYTMKYEVLEDVSFNNFREDFTFYTVMPKDNLEYEMLAFYSEADKAIEKPMNRRDQARTYILSKNCPYFALYKATEASSAKNDYVNLSFLIHSYEFTIGGKSVDPSFIISDLNQNVKLSLDLGKVDLKAGDTFTINAIIMPWGSQNTVYESEEEGFMAYKNVHDVRENSLINELKATAVKDCVVDTDSVFLPTVCSTNGKSAEFTLSGGANNCTVKIKGFTHNTIPTIYELKDGNWVRYNLSSFYYPDNTGYKNAYDGYSVQYAENGLFDYSIVVKMTPGINRTFKFVVDEAEYKNNPEIEPEINEDEENSTIEIVEGYNRFYGPEEMKIQADIGSMGKVEVLTDNTGSYTRFYGTGTGDPNFYLYSAVNEENPLPTGQFFVFKYRLSSSNTDGNWMTIFSSTEKMTASTSTTIKYTDMVKDDQWHVVVINYAATQPGSFIKSSNGGYYAKHLRFDVFGTSFPNTSYIDFQYMAFDDSFDEILAANLDAETVCYFDGDFYNVKTDGGKLPEKIIIEDDSRTYDTPFAVYFSARKLAHLMLNNGSGMRDDLIELVETPEGSYVTLWGNAEETPAESYLRFYNDSSASIATGQYLVIKYKTALDSYLEVYASTETTSPNNSEMVALTKKNKLLINNDEWQIVIIDLATLINSADSARGFNKFDDGKYYAQILRIDPFNSASAHATGLGVTLGFIGICGDDALADAIKYDTSVDAVLFYDGKLTAYDPNTGAVIEDYQTPTVTPPAPPAEEETTTTPISPDPEEPAESVEGYNRYFDAETLKAKGSTGNQSGTVDVMVDGDTPFARFYGTETSDPYFYLYRSSQDTNTSPTGQYLVFKYRLPEGQKDNNWIYFYTNTTTVNARTNITLRYNDVINDGNWQVIVFDLAAAMPDSYIKNDDGGYYAKHLRLDIFGAAFPPSVYIDIQFIAYDDSIEEILESCSDVDYISFYDGNFSTIKTNS